MAKAVSGGGINSRVTRHFTGYKREPVAKAQNVDAVAQQGRAVDFQRKPLEAGSGYTPQAMPATGIPGKFNAAKAGPGSGRTVYPSGGQSTYGPVAKGIKDSAPDIPATAVSKRGLMEK